MAKVEVEKLSKKSLGNVSSVGTASITQRRGPVCPASWAPRALDLALTGLLDSFGRGILGSSLSSGAARRRLRIRHEALEDGVGNAPLEAPKRLLGGLALIYLLALVGAAPRVRPCLAHCDHVQGVVELAIPGQREPVA